MKFKDKQGRIIEIGLGDDNTVSAFNNGTKVGEISLDVSEIPVGYNDETTLAIPHTMNVIEGYKRAGIGTQMIKCAKEKFDTVMFASDPGTVEDKDDYHYTDEGLAFKHYCEKIRLTKDPDEYIEDE